MDIDSTKLTVFFEDPFWIGVFERIERRKLSVCKSCLVQNQRTMKSGSICSKITVGCASVHLLSSVKKESVNQAIATANPKGNSCHRNRYKVTAGVANAARRKQAGAKST